MAQPKLIVIASPSGGGKTSIVRALIERHPDFEFSVSATTRQMRPGEVNGKDYFFLTEQEFKELIARDELVEHEFFYKTYYGTLKREVDRALREGHSMIFDVDVKGAQSIKKKYPNDTVQFFIAPPSKEILEQRLRNRKTEDEEKLRRRFERMPMELETGKTFDHVVVNDDLQHAIDRVDSIVKKFIQ
ncbi:MAG: guanylate kinase [Ignavibacteriales bacterium]|nr:guanylate kinase [Ignavibacteriales bacterium]